ncbi:MAG: hypothetical protein V3S37_05940 [Dehalococcoidia bacterium]
MLCLLDVALWESKEGGSSVEASLRTPPYFGSGPDVGVAAGAAAEVGVGVAIVGVSPGASVGVAVGGTVVVGVEVAAGRDPRLREYPLGARASNVCFEHC